MGRAPCCDKANVKKGPWSPEEDAKLKSHIEKHGTGGNWIALPQKIGLKRCGKSCRLRWLNYLRPNIKHGGFTEDEDNLICSLYVSIGSRWSVIAAQLPGRTDNDIKNYWNTRLKKKLLGKQQTRRINSFDAKKSGTDQKRCEQSYSINESAFPPPQQMAAPPLLVAYTSGGNWVHEQNLIEAKLCYDHTQYLPKKQGKELGAFDDHCNINPDDSCSQYQEMCKNSSNTSFVNHAFPTSESDICINFPTFDGIQEKQGMYNSMPQMLNGVERFSATDEIVNIRTISSSSSLENTSSVMYSQSDLTNYEVCHQEMSQYWTLLDEPRLLGYSQ